MKSSDKTFLGVTLWVHRQRTLGQPRSPDEFKTVAQNPFQRVQIRQYEPGPLTLRINDMRTLEIRLRPGQVYEVYAQSQAFWGWNLGGQKNIIFHGFSRSLES